MNDVVAGLIGIVLMFAFIGTITIRIVDHAFWVVAIVGLALMVHAFWNDWRAPSGTKAT